MKLKNGLMLALTALIWGMAFVAQSVGMEYIGPFTFNAVRSIIGGLVLIPCIWFLDRMNARGEEKKKEASDSPKSETERAKERRTLFAGGAACGVALCLASNLQQIGIQYTTVGKAGFITALYIVLVPILGMALGRRVGTKIWISVAVSVAGLYLLCITEEFRIGTGDTFVLLGALVFAVHIMVIDYFSPKVDGVKMSCIQFLVTGILSAIPMAVVERPSLEAIFSAAAPLLYAGILSCGVAYTLQIVAQKGMDPTIASLILSLESVFSVLAGWMILGQVLSARELMGCALMFGAIILAQLPDKKLPF